MSRIIRNILAILIFIALISSFLLINEKDLPPMVFENEKPNEYLPEIVKEETKKQIISKLSAHFPDQFIPKIFIEEKEVIPEIKVERGTIINNDIKFISTIVKSDITHFYFKMGRTGRLLDLTGSKDSEWELETIENEYFILRNGEDTYKVLKK